MTKAVSGRAPLSRVAQIGVGASMFLLALIAVLVALQVIARNFFDLGLPWADELARFSGIGLVFLTVPSLAARQLMVSVSILPDSLGPSPRRALVLLGDIAMLGFMALMLWGFAAFLPRAGKFVTPAIGLPNWFYYSLALLGSLALTAIAITRILATLRGRDPTSGHAEPGHESEPLL